MKNDHTSAGTQVQGHVAEQVLGCVAHALYRSVRPVNDGVAVARLVHAPTEGMPARASGVVRANVAAGISIGRSLAVAVAGSGLCSRCSSRTGRVSVLRCSMDIRCPRGRPSASSAIGSLPPSQPLSCAPSYIAAAAEHLRAGTRDRVAHAAAVAETVGEDVRRVDAVVVPEQLDHVVDELQVLPAGIPPAVAEPLRRDEDRAVVRELLQAEWAMAYPFEPPVSTSFDVPPFQWNPKINQYGLFLS